MSAKYDLPAILVALLEHGVEPILGKDTLAELKKPVTEAELQAELNAAARRAEARWVLAYPERDLVDVVAGNSLAGLGSVQDALRQMATSPAQPVVQAALRAGLAPLLPAGYPSERAERALADYLDFLRQELVNVDQFREKLQALASLALEREARATAAHTAQIAAGVDRLVSLAQEARRNETPGDEPLADLEARYRAMVAAEFEYLDFKGQVDTAEPLRLPLEKVYVQLRAVANVPERDEFTAEERRLLRDLEGAEAAERGDSLRLVREAQLHLESLRRERWSRDRLERFPIAEALAATDRPGLVILGDPGSGKTTLLTFLARVFAQGPDAVREHLQLTGPAAALLPIFAPLAYYDVCLNQAPRLGLGDFLSQYYAEQKAMPGLKPVFDAAIASGRALFLLDGLDEVVREDRRQFVATQASAWIRQVTGLGNRVLLTSRIYGYSAARLSTDLPHVTVLDFRREEIAHFARQLNQALAEWEFRDLAPAQRAQRAKEEERQLLAEVQSNPAVERLAANPLMLSMLALLRRKVGRLPQRRIRLYAQYLEALIERWEAARSRVRTDSPVHYDTSDTALVLIPLALWLHQNKPSGTAAEAEIVAQIADEFLRDLGHDPTRRARIPARDLQAAEKRARGFLADMRQFSGLLVERGHNAFDFRHLTFREYYVGRALARMTPAERWKTLKNNLHANRWREPLQLAVAQLGTEQSEPKAATNLVKKILAAKSPQEDLLHRDLFLAADCAADDVNVDITVLRRIVVGLEAAAHARVPLISLAACTRLGALARLATGGGARLPEAAEALARVAEARFQGGEAVFWIKTYAPLLAESATLRIATLAQLTSGRADECVEAIRAFEPLLGGDAALKTAVTERLGDANEDVRSTAIRALGPLLGEDRELEARVIRMLGDDTNSVVAAALDALRPRLQSDTNELVAAVVAKLADSSEWVRHSAVSALGPHLGQLPALKAAVAAKLEDPDSIVRMVTIWELAPYLGTDMELRNRVIARLEDTNTSVRGAAVGVVGSLLGADQSLRALVIARLNDISEPVRCAAIDALGPYLEEDATLHAVVLAMVKDRLGHMWTAPIKDLICDLGATPFMAEQLESTQARSRLAAATALAAETVSVRAYQERLGAALQNQACRESGPARAAAMAALGLLADGDESVRAALVAQLRDENPTVRAAALRGLGPWLGRDAALLKDAATLLTSTHAVDLRGALQALGPHMGQNLDLVLTASTLLDHADEFVRSDAIEALSTWLDSRQDAKRAVVVKLADPDWLVRRAAVAALKLKLVADPDLVQAVVQLLHHPVADARCAALDVLAASLAWAVDSRSAVIAALDDGDATVRASATKALGPLVGQDAALVSRVTALLGDADPYIRGTAIETLGPWLAYDAALTAAALEMLADPDGGVRSVAIAAVAPQLAEDSALRIAVMARLADADASVRRAAIEALGPQLAADESTRAMVLAACSDPDERVRRTTATILGLHVGVDPEVKAAVFALLGDPAASVRFTVVNAVRAFVESDEDLRAAVVAALQDKEIRVRAVALETLAPVVPFADMRQALESVLGSDSNSIEYANGAAEWVVLTPLGARESLAEAWGTRARTAPEVAAWARGLLLSDNEDLREAAAWLLELAGPEAVRNSREELLQALADRRGKDSWPARVAAAQRLLNEWAYSDRALQVLVAALDFGLRPSIVDNSATSVRREAALAVGTLKAIEVHPAAIVAIRRALDEETDPRVLDALAGALRSLVSAPV
ncbi:MAG TPA: HEAT repeat domain-containing protein [Anaerolineales bacterium]|nr:HEAT repeat domain-containing protein [Anaerolineales bacterium]